MTLFCRYNSSNPEVTSYQWRPPGSGNEISPGVLRIERVAWDLQSIECAACNRWCSWADPVNLNVHCECQGKACPRGDRTEMWRWKGEGVGPWTQTVGAKETRSPDPETLRGIGSPSQGHRAFGGDIRKVRESSPHLSLWPCRCPQSGEGPAGEPQLIRDPCWAARPPPVRLLWEPPRGGPLLLEEEWEFCAGRERPELQLRGARKFGKLQLRGRELHWRDPVGGLGPPRAV